ncbi:MAG: ABC transporter permease [Planctomycetota bacterium]
MFRLPLANILHHKLSSVLSALGVAIGICMLVTLTGLSRGTLQEIAQRWEAVDADVIVFPGVFTGDVANLSALSLPDRYVDTIAEKHPDEVDRVVPVNIWSMKLGGQSQMVVGIDPEDMPVVLGGREVQQGRSFDPEGSFARWIRQRVADGPREGRDVLEIDANELADPAHNGLEMVIDSRLAEAGRYEVGQTVSAAGHRWTIVGIVPAGGLARVYIPRRTAQWLFVDPALQRSTLMFVQLGGNLNHRTVAENISESIGQKVLPLASYRTMLTDRYRMIYTYVDIVNGIALVIAFLFTMVVLYTMVIQRTRDLAILKSAGASRTFLVAQVLTEGLILSLVGAAVGIALAPLAEWGLEEHTLLSVSITGGTIWLAVGVAIGGALLSGLYPAWRATRVDMLSALAME